MTNTKRKNRLINITCILMILIVLIGIFQLQAFAEEEPIKVKVNGKEIEFEQPPVIKNGRTLVPLRKIFEALGISVEWDSETRTVFAFKGSIVISIEIGSKTAMIQDEEDIETEVELDVPAQIIESRTFVPVRFIAESIGAEVKWDGDIRTVIINMTDEKTYQRIDFEDGYYEGELLNGIPNGYGKCVWNNGDIYEGNWFDGQKSGQGKYIWANGDIYEGNWHEGRIYGKGKYTFANGDIYEGEFADGEMIKGVVTKANGEKYEIDIEKDIEEEIKNDNKQNKENNFREQALNGPSYNELMKNSSKYLNTPDYFEGTVIQAVEYENGETIFLIDISSFMNTFIDLYNQYNDDLNYIDNLESKIIAVFSDTSVDIIQDDYVKIYGRVMENFTYEDIYGVYHTVPALKLVEYERSKRADELTDELFGN
ncbi:copper amine oxidase N-terminal domain-containing protein [Caloranaerobacter azorensis]|uniref:Copper amine oxidase-like N-terminal domain-containing protein n=1 Tax=Caloranaerobacter azorensis TaxID=116090 RepID=A0A6P1YG59_9FIRM|nr:copper amine oxidase N-terminal domain-containing protein [Caloranaerobacter azorensis]QIB27932.1 hypothetical protein G3A45_12025 [Caloranaerobacter azorensis]